MEIMSFSLLLVSAASPALPAPVLYLPGNLLSNTVSAAIYKFEKILPVAKSCHLRPLAPAFKGANIGLFQISYKGLLVIHRRCGQYGSGLLTEACQPVGVAGQRNGFFDILLRILRNQVAHSRMRQQRRPDAR